MANKKLTKQIILNKAEIMAIEKTDGLVNMRTIAKSLNVALGTLYNYFPSQESLWIEIFNRSWIKTENKLKNIIKSDEKKEAKLYLMFSEIINDINSRKGFGLRLMQYLKQVQFNSEISIINVKKMLEKYFILLIDLDDNEESLYKARLAISLIFSNYIELDKESYKFYEKMILK